MAKKLGQENKFPFRKRTECLGAAFQHGRAQPETIFYFQLSTPNYKIVNL
jgi:hypothetical protein